MTGAALVKVSLQGTVRSTGTGVTIRRKCVMGHDRAPGSQYIQTSHSRLENQSLSVYSAQVVRHFAIIQDGGVVQFSVSAERQLVLGVVTAAAASAAPSR